MRWAGPVSVKSRWRKIKNKDFWHKNDESCTSTTFINWQLFFEPEKKGVDDAGLLFAMDGPAQSTMPPYLCHPPFFLHFLSHSLCSVLQAYSIQKAGTRKTKFGYLLLLPRNGRSFQFYTLYRSYTTYVSATNTHARHIHIYTHKLERHIHMNSSVSPSSFEGAGRMLSVRLIRML